jgi:hypothetical protein
MFLERIVKLEHANFANGDGVYLFAAIFKSPPRPQRRSARLVAPLKGALGRQFMVPMLREARLVVDHQLGSNAIRAEGE